MRTERSLAASPLHLSSPQPHYLLSWGTMPQSFLIITASVILWPLLTREVSICLSPMIVMHPFLPWGKSSPVSWLKDYFLMNPTPIISVVLLCNTRLSSLCWMGQWIHGEKTEVVNFVKVWESDEAGWAQQKPVQRWHVGLVLWRLPLCFPFKRLLSFPSYFLVCARHCGKFMVEKDTALCS